jgi:UDP-2,3-diacylglucosamine hydrolase
MRGFVISDLHLFTDRSSAAEISASMQDQLADAEFLVLNGDIFDFEWTHFNSIEQTVEKAVAWLYYLAEQHPRCCIYYILGNHDELESFVQKVREIMLRLPNLHLFTSHLVLGNNLFFHGDLPLSRKNPWKRTPVKQLSRKQTFWHLCYDCAVKCRLHKVVYALFSPSYCAKRIANIFREYPRDFLSTIDHIYFGHTHLPFENFRHDRFLFSNTGAAISGVNARLIEVKT